MYSSPPWRGMPTASYENSVEHEPLKGADITCFASVIVGVTHDAFAPTIRANFVHEERVKTNDTRCPSPSFLLPPLQRTE